MAERQKYHLLSQKILPKEDIFNIINRLRGASIMYFPDGDKDYPKKEQNNYRYTLDCSLLNYDEYKQLTKIFSLEVKVIPNNTKLPESHNPASEKSAFLRKVMD